MTTAHPLPEAFCRRMADLMGDEWSELKQALEADVASRGVRLHRWYCPETAGLLASTDAGVPEGSHPATPTGSSHPTAHPLLAVETRLPLPDSVFARLGSPVPWAQDGYFVPTDTDLGRTIYHEAGAFYMQEPSAMAVVEALDPKPGETILDLCAAPGGKTTAIGARMCGHGVLVANEIHPDRVVILSQNIERTGTPAVVVNEKPDHLSHVWHHQFDAVLVDAPCSGEGMFRKERESRLEWTADSPERCAERQREILVHAVQMVKPGGRLVYSTCTLNPVENEQVVLWALANLPVVLERLPLWPGWSTGRAQWAEAKTGAGERDVETLDGTRRLWPHIGQGEGHFVARFTVVPEETTASGRPSETLSRGKSKSAKNQSGQSASKETVRAWLDLAEQLVNGTPDEWRNPIVRGSLLFAPLTSLPLEGIKVLRPGLPLCEVSGRILVPHHALAMVIDAKAAHQAAHISEEEAARFLGGETLAESHGRGWHLVSTNGLSLGWGKAVPGRLNNSYPKGLRKTRLVYYA